MKELLFSVTKKDFDIVFMKAGGKGGQHQNTTDSACRITHRDSGAVGESREEREQIRNKKIAFNRCVNSPKFQLWLKLKTSELMMEESVETKVNRLMEEHNIKTEIKNEKGQWTQIDLPNLKGEHNEESRD